MTERGARTGLKAKGRRLACFCSSPKKEKLLFWCPVACARRQKRRTHELILIETRKAPGALEPRRSSPPPSGDVKYVMVTQDKSPWLCSERHGEYFFGRAKTGGLGQVTTKKNTTGKKWVLPDPVLTAG